MASIRVPLTVTADVVKVAGVCYEYSDVSQLPPTDTPDKTFDTCDDCKYDPTPTPTPTPTPSPTPTLPNPCAPDPTILLTVTGTTGTVNWCGRTWTLPGDSGLQQYACPTYYQLQNNPPYSNFEQWKRLDTYYNDKLTLWRATGFATRMRIQFYARTGSGGPNGTDYRKAPSQTTLGLGVMTTGSPFPTSSDYRIPDAWFSSYTSGGITFAWERGIGW